MASFALQQFKERVNNCGLEVNTTLFPDIRQCSLFAPGSPVRPIVRKGIVNINNRKQARRQRNLLTCQTARVTSTVPLLMMRIRNVDRVTQKRDGSQEITSENSVPLHELPLGSIKLPGLKQNTVRNTHLPDVMQQRPTPDMYDFLFAHAHALSQPDGQFRYAAAVALGFLILQVKSPGPTLDGGVISQAQLLMRTLQVIKHAAAVNRDGSLHPDSHQVRTPVIISLQPGMMEQLQHTLQLTFGNKRERHVTLELLRAQIRAAHETLPEFLRVTHNHQFTVQRSPASETLTHTKVRTLQIRAAQAQARSVPQRLARRPVKQDCGRIHMQTTRNLLQHHLEGSVHVQTSSDGLIDLMQRGNALQPLSKINVQSLNAGLRVINLTPVKTDAYQISTPTHRDPRTVQDIRNPPPLLGNQRHSSTGPARRESLSMILLYQRIILRPHQFQPIHARQFILPVTQGSTEIIVPADELAGLVKHIKDARQILDNRRVECLLLIQVLTYAQPPSQLITVGSLLGYGPAQRRLQSDTETGKNQGDRTKHKAERQRNRPGAPSQHIITQPQIRPVKKRRAQHKAQNQARCQIQLPPTEQDPGDRYRNEVHVQLQQVLRNTTLNEGSAADQQSRTHHEPHRGSHLLPVIKPQRRPEQSNVQQVRTNRSHREESATKQECADHSRHNHNAHRYPKHRLQQSLPLPVQAVQHTQAAIAHHSNPQSHLSLTHTGSRIPQAAAPSCHQAQFPPSKPTSPKLQPKLGLID